MRERHALLMLIVWTTFVAVTTVIGIGFAGGVRRAFFGNPEGLLFVASPIVLFTIWLWRQRKHKPVEKPE